MRCVFGILVLLFLCYLMSEKKKAINYREVAAGIAIQFILAYMFLKMPYIKDVFLKFSGIISGLKTATDAGTKFVFGYVGGGDTPFTVTNPGNLFVFAFQALPMIIVVSAISMLLFHWGWIQKFVLFFSKVINKFSNIGGILGVVSSAKLFVGQTEAPLLVRPYLSKISKSELFSIITCGLATTSGAGMVLYSMILDNRVPNALAHMMTVTAISIPAALVISRMVIPQEGKATDGGISSPYNFSGSIDAISRGTSDGLNIILNLSAILVVAIALISIINQILSVFPDVYGAPVTLQRIFGIFFTPIAYLIGIPYEEIFKAGELLSEKLVVNEMVAYLDLASTSVSEISEKSATILSYALCGFANFSSIGIVVGSYATLVPERNNEVNQICVKAIICGSIATCLSAAVVGGIL